MIRASGGIALIATLLTVTLPLAWAQQPAPTPVPPAEFGEVFPGATFENLNVGVGGADEIDLNRMIGKKPIILCYWIAGNTRSEQVFQELQQLVDELGAGQVLLYGVVTERPGLGAREIVERIRTLKVHAPVLNDRGFVLGQRLQVRHVPSISILDAEGKLRLANAGSLRQTLEYKLDVAGAIRRLAEGKPLGTYGPMPKYYPVTELVGEKAPSFEAPLLGETRFRALQDLISADKVNVLVFWSVNCPHCRKTLPGLNEWYKANGKRFNLMGAVRIPDPALRTKTQEFVREQGIVFPSLEDPDGRIFGAFQIVSTPTFVLIRPDGVVDSVILTGGDDLGKELEAKARAILGGERAAKP